MTEKERRVLEKLNHAQNQANVFISISKEDLEKAVKEEENENKN